MQNALSPGYIKIHYDVVISSVSLSHVMTLPVALDAPFVGSSSLLNSKGGSAIAWHTYVDTLIALLKTQWSATSTFTGVELFSQADAESEPFFEDVYVLSVVGTNGSGALTAGQAIMTFKTLANGLLKLSMMETSVSANLRQNYSAMSAAQKAIADHILASGCCVWGRDNNYGQLFLHLTTKTNDKLRKHRFNL